MFVAAVLLPLVASFAVAQHAHGGHQNIHEKRDVVWTTVIDYVTTTVDITTTIWVDANAAPSTSSSSVIVATPVTTTTATTFTTLTTSSQQPAEFHEELSSTIPPAPSSTSVSIAPPPPPPPASSTAAAAAPPPDPPVVVAPVAVVPTTSTTPIPPPVATSAAPASPPVAASPPSSGGASSGGPCSSGSPCSGDITFYEAGLGACGTDDDGTLKNVIALPYGLMGTQSNGNPYCYKTVTITKGTASITATVVDKCMGCQGESIDLSHAAWTALGLDYGLGRTQASWFFN